MYLKKTAVYIPRLKIVLCISIVSWTTTTCNRYRLEYDTDATNSKTPQAKPNTNSLDQSINQSMLFQADKNGMTVFCKAIEAGDYKKLKACLQAIAYPHTTRSDDVIYLITGVKKQDNKQHPTKALLDQVITSETNEIWAHKQEVLNILFETLLQYGFELEQAFLQKHGQDQNTIIHLAVGTGDLDIVTCLTGWYLKKDSTNDLYGQMKVCSMPNREGTTPLWMALQAIYHDPLTCGMHGYDNECETCDYEIERTVNRQDIVLHLLNLGVPFYETIKPPISAPPSVLSLPSLKNRGSKIKSALHYASRHDAGDFLIEMMETIQKRAINKYTPEELVSLQDKTGSGVLFYVVRSRNYKLAEYVLASGACPMQANEQGTCPILCAVAFRDIRMLKFLLRAKCLLERICNIHKHNNYALKILTLAKSPDCGGICAYLKKYCNKFKTQYGRQIVPNEWNWQTNHEIEQLLSYLCNYFAVNSIKEPNLPFHTTLGRDFRSRKIDHTDNESNNKYSFRASMNQNNRKRMASKPEFPCKKLKVIRTPMSLLALPMPTPSPFGGG
ncbi:Ankyrin repeats containing protein [Cardinium endosymbiont of Sogatella furcifera]|uniref:ankyrin repeat domain-containing protein n=1 Tax=Cardinium endosymbiont of Sogatella furcifera TaxID=650378 RepID=UPI000E0DE455|nr:ankyrin repeat domain-containing protein [Cardinium endosymbiont of Sogatella furcifera]AXI24250.1 Ankyrin repeats containing protein [Cardinium endosymbiont of Sogatella furcifera]